MLKFLTHKLRTHSINENNSNEKGNEDHDSGTESDDETEYQLPNTVMDQSTCSISPADTGCSVESPISDLQDAHSSEEELEVINNNSKEQHNSPLTRSTSSVAEKRKWSQVSKSYSSIYTPDIEENISHYTNVNSWFKNSDDTVQIEHSSDEEVHNLLASMATPVQFRTSPPEEAVKPGGRTTNTIESLSPLPKLLNYSMSPRKRSKHTRHVHMQRPYLDFEKMQQLKARSVTAWKHTGDHGGELSVFCW